MNPFTQRLYVTHGLTGQPGANTVSVLDADTGLLIASIPVSGGPDFIQVNSFTNKIYMAQPNGSDIVVIDGVTNAVVTSIPVGGGSHDIAIDEASNTIYATVRLAGKLVVIDGAADTVRSTVTLGGHPWAVAVNPVRQRIYVTKDSLFVPGDTVSVLDSTSLDVLSTIAVGQRPLGITTNPLTDRVYVSHINGGAVYVLEAHNGAVLQIATTEGSAPFGIGVNLLTDRVYVANAVSHTVSVIGDDLEPPVWPAGSQLSAIAINLRSISLQWNPATDNSKVQSYRVYRDGVLAGVLPGYATLTTFIDLTAGTTYLFKVEACDTVANCTTDGPGLVVSTLTVQDAINRLSEMVSGLVSSGALGSGPATGLLGKLQQASDQYEAGRLSQAVSLLDAFISEVEAFEISGLLSSEYSFLLILEARLIRVVIVANQ